MKEIYQCQKCGFISKEESNKDHAKICNGKLEEAKGKCIEIAFCNVIKDPSLFFCYGIALNKNDQEYFHSWNEDRKGNIIDSSEKKEIRISKSNYYRMKGIKKGINKLDIKAIISNMNKELNKEKRIINIWEWIK